MSKCIVIIGAPGSGKSYLAKQLSQGNSYLVFDDFVVPAGKEESENYLAFLQAMSDGKDCIICDPEFCFDAALEGALNIIKHFNYEIDCIFFENDADQCLANVKSRDDGRKVDKLIKLCSYYYNIPQGHTPIPVYRKIS